MKLTETQRCDRAAILQNVASMELDGEVDWSRLHARGHHFMTITALVRSGLLAEPRRYTYRITEAGRAALQEDQTK